MIDDEVPLLRTTEPAPFRPGASVVLRSVRDFGPPHGVAVGFAVAASVLVDDGDIAVVSTLPGAPLRSRAGRGTGPTGRVVLPSSWDGSYAERTWQGDAVVRVHRRGDRWSVWRWHDGTRWTDRWYGNLESAWRRSTIGFDTQDWVLDVVGTGVPVDCPWSVQLKDEDELAWMVETGEVTQAEATHVRQVGARLLAQARRAQWPFDADWDAWLPDHRSALPSLPPGWDRIDSQP